MATTLTLEEAEAIVGEPAQDWVARCYEIAHKLAERVEGVNERYDEQEAKYHALTDFPMTTATT